MSAVLDEQLSVEVSAEYPDRLLVGPELLKQCASLITADEVGSWVPVSSAWKLRDALGRHQAAAALELVAAESKAASQAHWRGESYAWLIDEHRAVVQTPYRLTLRKRMSGLSSPYFYSPLLNGWVISDLDADAAELALLINDYDVTASVGLLDRLEGRTGWAEALEDTVARAKASGLEAPSGFLSGRTLRPHQVQGVLALAYQGVDNQGGRLLADQVGLGKGGEFVCGALALQAYFEKNDPSQTVYPLVVSVTKSMKEEIVEEILRWKHDANIVKLEGTKSAWIDPEAEFIVLNHDLISRRLDDLMEVKPHGFIADEAHVFKNVKSARTKAATDLCAAIRKNTKTPYLVLASGTPFLNAPVELWSQLVILGLDQIFGDYALERVPPEVPFWRSVFNPKTKRKEWTKLIVKTSRRVAFEMYFCGGRYDKFHAWHSDGAKHTAELHRLLIETGVMIRRRKSDIMHPLPDLNENLVFLQGSEEAMEEYERARDEFRDWAIEEALKKAKTEKIDTTAALRDVLKKLEAGEDIMQMTAMRRQLAFAKVDATVEWIHRFMAGDPEVTGGDESRRKLIVFVHHQEPRQMLVQHPELAQYGLVTILAGDEQKGSEIQAAKRRFQSDPDCRLIVCTMAAREGHTLTAAKDVFLMEIPFVPSWIVQMAGRCWARMSEDYAPHEATLHYGVVDKTIDSSSMRRVRLKKAKFNAVIDGEGQDESIQDFGKESIESLLEDLAIGSKELTVAR